MLPFFTHCLGMAQESAIWAVPSSSWEIVQATITMLCTPPLHPQALASEAMAIIGEALELPTAVTTPYRSTSDVLRDESLLQTLHHDASSGYFLDYGLHTEDCRLGKKSFPVDGKMQVRGTLCGCTLCSEAVLAQCGCRLAYPFFDF